MMRPDAKVQKVYLYPKPVDFRKSINGLAALVELDIKVEVFNPVLFVFLNRTRSQVKILYWERNVRIPRHSDTQPTLIRTPVPRSFGQAVGAQRRRGGIVSPGWLASSISASVCALIHPSD